MQSFPAATPIASKNNLPVLQGDGSVVENAGFRGIPQVSFSTNITIALSYNGKYLYHPSIDVSARTITIDSNTNLPLPIGFAFTIINDSSAGTITITITNDILILAGAGTTGSRTLAANGIATIVKMTATRWIINGAGIT